MSPARTWLYLGPVVALVGVIVFTVFAPRAKAAQEGLAEYETPRTHQLWSCTDKTSCRPVGKPMNSTACALDLASLANASPKGARLICRRIER